MHRVRTLLRLAIVMACAGCAVAPGVGAENLASMRDAADRGEAALGVPADLVLAIAWTETRWVAPVATEVDDAEAHGALVLGVAGIRPDLPIDPLAVVAERLAVPALGLEERLRSEPAFATLAAAAVLRVLAEARFGDVPSADDPGAWRLVIADYAGLDGRAGADHAEYVLDVLRRGMVGDAETGERLLLRSRDISASTEITPSIEYLGAQYAGATWTPASSSNYTAGRGGHSIRYVVIHTTQGSYAGAVSWFRNPSASVSAHYVIRSSDGVITQMVQHGDTGWHAGNWTYNQESIGIEHEGFVADPGRWYTDAMYRSSAALTRHLCETYGIPIDRAHIIGHNEVPGATHTDPGSGWDWNRYMTLVRGEPPRPAYDATAGGRSVPADMVSGERVVAWVEYTNTGSSTWDVSLTRLGTSHPQDHASPFFDAENWMNDHRASGADHSGYATGSVGRFTFMLRAPEVTADTTVTDTFRLVHEGASWFAPEITLSVRVHPRPVSAPVDVDRDGSPVDVDCDDADATRHPGASETCGDGIDQDCDGADARCAAPDAGAVRSDAGVSTGRDGGAAGSDAGTTSSPRVDRRSTAGGCSVTTSRARAPIGVLLALVFALASRRRTRR